VVRFESFKINPGDSAAGVLSKGLMPEFTFGIMPPEFPDGVQVACQELALGGRGL
jgi:hypothetical protein